MCQRGACAATAMAQHWPSSPSSKPRGRHAGARRIKPHCARADCGTMALRRARSWPGASGVLPLHTSTPGAMHSARGHPVSRTIKAPVAAAEAGAPIRRCTRKSARTAHWLDRGWIRPSTAGRAAAAAVREQARRDVAHLLRQRRSLRRYAVGGRAAPAHRRAARRHGGGSHSVTLDSPTSVWPAAIISCGCGQRTGEGRAFMVAA